MVLQSKQIIKVIILCLFWLIFLPLFLVLFIIWKTLWLASRIALTVLAPLTIIDTIVKLFAEIQYYYYHYFERGSRSKFEIMYFPDCITYEKQHFRFLSSFLGDNFVEYMVKLNTTNIRDFYRQIDLQLAKNQEDQGFTDYWKYEPEGNYYYINFGNPKDEDEQNLKLNLHQKMAIVRIYYGRM